MKDYNTDICNSCGASIEDLTIDGEDVKLTYYQGLLLCQSCIEDMNENDDFGQENE